MLERVGDRPAFLTFDIDVVDPAHAPGTGTPEAGGPSARDMLAILRRLTGIEFVGFDVVEVIPATIRPGRPPRSPPTWPTRCCRSSRESGCGGADIGQGRLPFVP